MSTGTNSNRNDGKCNVSNCTEERSGEEGGIGTKGGNEQGDYEYEDCIPEAVCDNE